MVDSTDGWRAHITPDIPMIGDRLVVYRRFGDHIEFVTGHSSDGKVLVERHEPHTASPFQGLLMPLGSLDAIAEALKPGPSRGEMRAVADALDLERRRVDEFLAELRAIVGRGHG